MKAISTRQREVLTFIVCGIVLRGEAPTFAEIATLLGVASKNGVNDHIERLERKGYLSRDRYTSRSLRPTHAGLKALGL